MDELGEIEKSDILPIKSGIPKPTSRPSSRPLSRPTPSARVRALGKEGLEDIDQNSPDDDGSDEDDDEEDDDEAVHIEGERYPIITAPGISQQSAALLHRRRSAPLMMHASQHDHRPKMKSAHTLNYRNPVNLADFSWSDCSLEDELCFDPFESLEDDRDRYYLQLPYHSRRAYNPADFEHLSVSSEIKELFQYITRYTPQTIELDHKLRPFIPEYIPAVGDIDAFIKVPRPDGEPDKLGLVALDEPCAKQSDPTVLDLQLRALTKETSSKAVIVKKLENADKRPKEVDAWISSIANLHQSKPPPTVHYSRNMPDIENLMQEWPEEVEKCCNEVGLPTADLDCSLEEYVDIVCGLLDIPVYKSRIQSLHVLFSLYMEFKNSQHFRSLSGDVENPNEE